MITRFGLLAFIKTALNAPWYAVPDDRDFYDYNDCPDASIFNGWFSVGEIMVGPTETSRAKVGGAYGISSFFEKKFGMGLEGNMSIIGRSYVLHSETRDCDENCDH